MKLTLLALFLLAFTTNAGASPSENEWVVTARLESGTEVEYEVLPKSVTRVMRGDDPEYQVVLESVEIANGVRSSVRRHRLRVNGCERATGKVALATMAGTLLKGTEIFEWDVNGERVYDMLAARGCYAWLLKHGGYGNSTTPSPSTSPKTLI